MVGNHQDKAASLTPANTDPEEILSDRKRKRVLKGSGFVDQMLSTRERSIKWRKDLTELLIVSPKRKYVLCSDRTVNT